MPRPGRDLIRRCVTALRNSLIDPRSTRKALRRETDKLRTQLQRVEAKYEHARTRIRKLQSVAVDGHHLKSMLPLRAAALRGWRDDAALHREQHLLLQSDAYGAAKRAWEAGERPS